jgi:hypothetical protein
MKKVSLFLILAFLLFGHKLCHAQTITYIGGNTTGGNPATTVNATLTIAAADKMILSSVTEAGSWLGNITSASWNSANFTRVLTTVSSSNYQHLWYLDAPASGTHNLIVTYGGSTYFNIRTELYNGTATGAPENYTGVALSSSAWINLTVVPVSSYTVYIASLGTDTESSLFYPQSGQTENFDAASPSPYVRLSTQYKILNASGSTQLNTNVTWTGVCLGIGAVWGASTTTTAAKPQVITVSSW